jgi:hypothetical protein
MPPGRFRRDLEWCRVYSNRTFENLVVVRVHGIPMFTHETEYDGTLVLELTGTSADRLTANRDGLKHPYQYCFNDFVRQLTVDRRTALKNEEPSYRHYAGEKLKRRIDTIAFTDTAEAVVERLTTVAARLAAPPSGAGIQSTPLSVTEAPAPPPIRFNFYLKDCRHRAFPREFDPDSDRFCDHARWLIGAWAGCLVELYTRFQIDRPFSIGFVLNDDLEAESESSSERGQVYFVNPIAVAGHRCRRRFKKSDRGKIAALAAHEFVHGGFGLSYHGEDFANTLTDVLGTVVTHWRRFARHFR